MSSVTHEFTMDPNLLVSVIKSQAGTLAKAILEGVMNSIDAGASRVDVTVTTHSFKIEDNGRGFTSEDEIKLWFGRFGTPHTQDDAIYGRFRMGRGQMMAFAATDWQSGEFQMLVDIENKGLTYELHKLQKSVSGCVVEGRLYTPMHEWKLADTLTQLKKFVAYTPKPVYVNGELYGEPAARLKNWTSEDEHAYYRVVHDSHDLAVYNQGVFVEDLGSHRTGMGGVIVSKRALDVNFARNSVMEDTCPIWRKIRAKLETLVFGKLTAAKKLDDAERKYLARKLTVLRDSAKETWRDAKVLTDPSGKHLALSELKGFKRFVHVAEAGPLACSVHGDDGTFVVTDKLLTRFGTNTVSDLLDYLQRVDGDLLDPNYTIVDSSQLADMGLEGISHIEASTLMRKDRAALAALSVLNARLAERLVGCGLVSGVREMLVGRHQGKAMAWTDGKTYITGNRKSLRILDRGLDGVLEWLMILLHEYTHDTDDSESHDHGEVFYRKFHDSVFMCSALHLGQLANEGLAEYLRQLNNHGLHRPRKLSAQLGKVKFARVKSEHVSHPGET